MLSDTKRQVINF